MEGRIAHLERELAASEAERALMEWAVMDAMRDELVLRAAAAGVAKNRIHKITGIARSTIDRILEQHSQKEA